MQAFVEDDAALVAHLLAGLEGAEVKMRTLRMRGLLDLGAAAAAVSSDTATSVADMAAAATLPRIES